MSDYWKLQIQDYTDHELHDMFDLKDPYTLEDIVNADLVLNNRIIADSTMDSGKKTQILSFLTKAREKLIQDHKIEMSHLKSTPLHVGGSHMIQKRMHFTPGQPLLDTKGDPIPIYKKVLAINSKFRDDYYGTLSTDFLLNLPTRVGRVVSMGLTGFELPNTYFQISKSMGNNFFWLGWQKSAPLLLKWYFIAVPDGTYSRKSMQTIINEQIQKATGLPATECPQCSIDAASIRTIFALPNTTPNPAAFLQLAFNRGKDVSGNTYTVTDPSQNNLNPSEINGAHTNIAQNLGWILGFRMAEYKASTAYVSEGVYDNWGIKYIYVIVNDFNKNFANLIEPVYNSSLGRDNILARISLAPISTSITNGTSLSDQFNPGYYIRNYFGPIDIEKMRITIVDEFGRILNLNNMDFSLALSFTCLYS